MSTKRHLDSENIDPAPKKTAKRCRTQFSPQQIDHLESHFHLDPYPDVLLKRDIAANLGLSEQTVVFWFQNRRAKRRRTLLNPCKRKRSEKAQTASSLYYANELPPSSSSNITNCKPQHTVATPRKECVPLKTSTPMHPPEYSLYPPYQLQQNLCYWPSPNLYLHPEMVPAPQMTHPSIQKVTPSKTSQESPLSITNLIKH